MQSNLAICFYLACIFPLKCYLLTGGNVSYSNQITLEHMLVGLRSSPPQTAADFLASIVSHYGVPIFHASESTDASLNSTIPSDSLRQYSTSGKHESVWIPNTSNRKNSFLSDVPQSANCEPEVQTVHLSQLIGVKNPGPRMPNTDVYFPHCIRLPKCGGCCPSQRLQCVPKQTTKHNISIMHVQYSFQERKFQFYGVERLVVEKHTECGCECIQKQTDCASGQHYLIDECRCICPAQAKIDCFRRQRMHDNILAPFINWNSAQCLCECKPPGGVWRCSTGFHFNQTNCRCELDQQQTNQIRPDDKQSKYLPWSQYKTLFNDKLRAKWIQPKGVVGSRKWIKSNKRNLLSKNVKLSKLSMSTLSKII